MADGNVERGGSETHVHYGTISKENRYDWLPPGRRGELRWVRPTDVRVPKFQRTVNERKVNDIARAFSWAAFGVVLLFEVQIDGAWELFVYAGQHRVLGARRRKSVTEVPALVFRLTQEEAARAFLVEATNRKPLTGIDKHKARLMIKDPAAILVDDLVARSGRVMMTGQSANSVSCVALLTTLAERDPAALAAMWPLITQLAAGHALLEMHVDPLIYIERHGSESLLSTRWKKRILDLGHDGVVGAAKRSAAYFKRGGAAVWAKGIVEDLNCRIPRDRQLVLRDSASVVQPVLVLPTENNGQ